MSKSSTRLTQTIARQQLASIRAARLANQTPIPEVQLLAEARELPLARYRNDPIGFCKDVLGLQVWWKQEEILEAVVDQLKIAIRSGQKTGKTTIAVAIALWFVATRSRAIVIVTATTFPQVKTIVWKELRRIFALPGVAEKLGGKMNMDPRTGLQFTDGRCVVGISTDKTEGMAGFSSPEMMFIVDEASGVERFVFEAIEGNRMGGDVRLILFGNPTKTEGVFFEAFHEKSAFWRRIHVSSEETPNCSGRGPPIPGLASPVTIEEKRIELGIESAEYQIRVLGNFATSNSNAVVGLGLILAAKQRYMIQQSLGFPEDTGTRDELCFGVDVARFGDDDTVIYPRRGLHVFVPTVLHGADGNAIARVILQLVRDMRRMIKDDAVVNGQRWEVPQVKIDGTGGYGGSVVDALSNVHGKELVTIEINASEASNRRDKYKNLRAQMHFAVALFLKEGGYFPPDNKLEAELRAPIFFFDEIARKQIESKADIKKKLGRSPDLADALALAVYCPDVGYAGRLPAVTTYDSPIRGGI